MVARAVRESISHLLREKRITAGSFLVLMILLVLIDLFWIASLSLTREYDDALRSVQMEVFIEDAVPDSILPVLSRALNSFPEVDTVEYVSKEAAAGYLEAALGGSIMEGLDRNPLPRSFVLSFSVVRSLQMLDSMETRLDRLDGVESIEFGRSWIEKVEQVGNQSRRFGAIFGAIILFVVLLTIANTNRLTSRSKSREFFQLKLLGAGPEYLIVPYLFEGFISALIAAAIGWLALHYLQNTITLTTIEIVTPPLLQIGIYCLAIGFVGAIGAYFGIRRHLAQ